MLIIEMLFLFTQHWTGIYFIDSERMKSKIDLSKIWAQNINESGEILQSISSDALRILPPLHLVAVVDSDDNDDDVDDSHYNNNFWHKGSCYWWQYQRTKYYTQKGGCLHQLIGIQQQGYNKRGRNRIKKKLQ